MTIKRYILIGIPSISLLILIVSLVIPKQGIEMKKSLKDPLQAEEPSATAQKLSLGVTDRVNQVMEGLYLPNYNESGQETLIMRGKNAVLVNENIYKIIKPEIEVLDTKKEGNTGSVFITSENGEMNKTSNEGYLSENVTVQFDLETQLNTNYLQYFPKKKIVSTDDFVTIRSKGMIITGHGCEIDLIKRQMRIKSNPEMETNDPNNDIFFLSPGESGKDAQFSEKGEGGEDGTTARRATFEKTLIHSEGPLVFEQYTNANIMTFHDNVEVKKGNSTIFSDKLVIFLDPETKKAIQAIASGDILFSQGTKMAKGNSLTWDVNTQSVTLEDPNEAEFVNGNNFIINASKLILYRTTGKIDVPSSGSLKARTVEKANEKEIQKGIHDTDSTIYVKWNGSMNFSEQDSRQAYFEKDVEVRREDFTLLCNKLDVLFGEHGFTLQSLKAREKVHIIDRTGGLYNEAFGEVFTWSLVNKVATLKGQPLAVMKEGNRRIIFSPVVTFFEDKDLILCEGKGSLYEKGKDSANAEDSEQYSIKVNWAKKMLYNDALQKVSFYEMVEATNGGQKLQGDQMDLFLDENQRVHKIIAAGNVCFFSEKLNSCEGFGSLLTWDIIHKKAVMTGDPKTEIRKEGSRTFAEQVYFDMDRNRITWEGRSQWQILSKETGQLYP